MKFFILTDLEGVVGVDRFAQTRTRDLTMKAPGMKQLAREVNACTEGIRSVYPDAVVDVLDGHGSGGLFREDVVNANYLSLKDCGKTCFQLLQEGYDALLFVGQHAMAGTINAPLNHTYSSLHVQYYRLNGVYVGEFGSRALQAGILGIPTIFLSGDDKAALEAKMFVPEIETVVTKYGKGVEAAEHLDPDEVCRMIREGAARAVKRMKEIPPFTSIQPPYVFEARYYEPLSEEFWQQRKHAVKVDDRTYRIETDDISLMPF